MILLVGPSRSGKTKLLRQLGDKLNIEPLNVGLELGRRLAATPNNKRGFSAGELLRRSRTGERTEDPLLLDNLELLFERACRSIRLISSSGWLLEARRGRLAWRAAR